MNAVVVGIFEKDIVRLCDRRLWTELRQMADLLGGSRDATDYKVVGFCLIFFKHL